MKMDDDLTSIDTEVEILKSIFEDDIKVITNEYGTVLQIVAKITPKIGDSNTEKYVKLSLVFNIPTLYPYEVPDIEFQNPRGLSDELLNNLKDKLTALSEASLGTVMMYTLIDAALDIVSESNLPSGTCSICLYNFDAEDQFSATKCFHYFHDYCLSEHINHVFKKYQDDLNSNREPNKPFPKLKVECPICRLEISYKQFQGKTFPPPIDSSADTDNVISSDFEALQRGMKALYCKQLNQGGIIDIEAERNRFLLQISKSSTPIIIPDIAPLTQTFSEVEAGPSFSVQSIDVPDGNVDVGRDQPENKNHPTTSNDRKYNRTHFSNGEDPNYFRNSNKYWQNHPHYNQDQNRPYQSRPPYRKTETSTLADFMPRSTKENASYQNRKFYNNHRSEDSNKSKGYYKNDEYQKDDSNRSNSSYKGPNRSNGPSRNDEYQKDDSSRSSAAYKGPNRSSGPSKNDEYQKDDSSRSNASYKSPIRSSRPIRNDETQKDDSSRGNRSYKSPSRRSKSSKNIEYQKDNAGNSSFKGPNKSIGPSKNDEGGQNDEPIKSNSSLSRSDRNSANDKHDSTYKVKTTNKSNGSSKHDSLHNSEGPKKSNDSSNNDGPRETAERQGSSHHPRNDYKKNGYHPRPFSSNGSDSNQGWSKGNQQQYSTRQKGNFNQNSHNRDQPDSLPREISKPSTSQNTKNSKNNCKEERKENVSKKDETREMVSRVKRDSPLKKEESKETTSNVDNRTSAIKVSANVLRTCKPPPGFEKSITIRPPPGFKPKC